jgi:Holliday junction resolvase-like predicted endonuclease
MPRPDASTEQRARAINRRQQGDLGEASAIEWFSRLGATILLPFGHSPDYDLIVDVEGRILRVQVKTCTCNDRRSDGSTRWSVQLATNGGNQSWTGVAKVFDPSRFDVLFVIVGDGRRWLIPADAIEAARGIYLGGLKYSEFEIEAGAAIDQVVYGSPPPLESDPPLGEYPSGQRVRTVNPWASMPSQVRILPPPSSAAPDGTPEGTGDTTSFERKLGRTNQVIMRPKRQVTLPKQPFLDAGLRVGDRMCVRAEGAGHIVFERIEPVVNGLASAGRVTS